MSQRAGIHRYSGECRQLAENRQFNPINEGRLWRSRLDKTICNPNPHQLVSRAILLQSAWPVVVVGFLLLALPAVLLTRRLGITVPQQEGQHDTD